MLVADTESGPLHQYEQPSNTENETAEIHQIEDKLKKNEMEHRQLLKRHQELHQQNLPTRQQLQITDRPQIQNLGSTITPSTTGQNHIAPVSNFDRYAWQRIDPGIDSRYDAGSTESSHLGFPELLSN